MSLGVMPSDEIEKKYGFHDYLALGKAVMTGNLKAYEEVSFSWYFSLSLKDNATKAKRIYCKWNIPCLRTSEDHCLSEFTEANIQYRL